MKTHKQEHGVRHERERERGQSLTEFAISLTMLLWIVVGVLDMGRMYMSYVAVQNAAAEGALFAAIHPTWIDTCQAGHIGCNSNTVDTVKARARHEGAGMLVDWSTATINVINTSDPPVVGQPVVVTVTYRYYLFTPILSSIWPYLDLTGTGEQLVMGTDWD